MRRIWWYAIGGSIALAALVAVAVVVFAGGGGTTSNAPPGAPPPASTTSYGLAQLSATTLGKSYNRTVIVHAQAKNGGKPICKAAVSVYGLMTAPHTMVLIPRNLHEVKCGMYRGSYTFIMQGTWTLNIQLRSKKLGASTSALPLTVGSTQ